MKKWIAGMGVLAVVGVLIGLVVVMNGVSANPGSINANTALYLNNEPYTALTIESRSDGASFIDFNNEMEVGPGQMIYSHSGGLYVFHDGSQRETADRFGRDVGIGTTSPAQKLHINDVLRLEPRASAPSGPAMGDIYFDSSINKLLRYDGTTWRAFW